MTELNINRQLYVDRAEHLNDDDRKFVLAFWKTGTSLGALATDLKVSATSLRRRLRGLEDHMTSPLFRFVLDSRSKWTKQRQLVASLFFLEDRTLKEVASISGYTYHTVRQEVHAVYTLAESNGVKEAA